MPFGVTKWPSPCDPRDPCFCNAGFAHGGATAFQYRASSVAVASPFDILLPPGLLIPFSGFGTGGECQFTVITPTLFIQVAIFELGTPPYLPAPAPTVHWSFFIQDNVSFQFAEGFITSRLPQPVAAVPAIDMTTSPPPERFSNPLLLTPAAWDAT